MGVTGSATQSSVGDQSVATLASSSLRSVMLEYDGLSFDLSKGFYDYYQFKIFDFERNLIFKNDKENRQKCRFNTVLGYMTSFLSEEQKSIMQSQPKDSTSPMFTTWLSKVKTLSLFSCRMRLWPSLFHWRMQAKLSPRSPNRELSTLPSLPFMNEWSHSSWRLALLVQSRSLKSEWNHFYRRGAVVYPGNTVAVL